MKPGYFDLTVRDVDEAKKFFSAVLGPFIVPISLCWRALDSSG